MSKYTSYYSCIHCNGVQNKYYKRRMGYIFSKLLFFQFAYFLNVFGITETSVLRSNVSETTMLILGTKAIMDCLTSFEIIATLLLKKLLVVRIRTFLPHNL